MVDFGLYLVGCLDKIMSTSLAQKQAMKRWVERNRKKWNAYQRSYRQKAKQSNSALSKNLYNTWLRWYEKNKSRHNERMRLSRMKKKLESWGLLENETLRRY